MAYRNMLKLLLKRYGPIPPALLYTTNVPLFSSPNPPKNPNDDQKLQFETLDAANLSYDYLMKQSTVNAVNSASQAITITYTAIESTSKEYRFLLTRLIVLLNEAMMREVSDSHWDEVLDIRAQMQIKKKILLQFIGYMEYVHKMAEAASEISFLAGMDNLSSSLTQRIDDAIQKIHTEKTNNAELEHEYVRVQEESIKKSDKNKGENVVKDVQIIDLDDLNDDDIESDN